MTSSIDLLPEELQLVRSIIVAFLPTATVCAFGSRVMGRAKPTSDLDLCVMDEPGYDALAIERLRSAFSESRLPMKVDVVEWKLLRDDFRRLIEKNCVPIR